LSDVSNKLLQINNEQLVKKRTTLKKVVLSVDIDKKYENFNCQFDIFV